MLLILFTSLIAPLFVGIAIKLFSRWLDDKDKTE
ncbi:type I toxin-antitoxin system Fst family toxin [Lactococcus lactis subsp. lactis]|nr:type I toxin-antitoxin system Fst family toxin [Lactococcus lactis]MCT0017765.1 type I toxin-antitoxin system Fst family toxin [Lactococcus lactis subsp. lactis]